MHTAHFIGENVRVRVCSVLDEKIDRFDILVSNIFSAATMHAYLILVQFVTYMKDK